MALTNLHLIAVTRGGAGQGVRRSGAPSLDQDDRRERGEGKGKRGRRKKEQFWTPSPETLSPRP